MEDAVSTGPDISDDLLQTMVRAALEGVRDLIDRLALREQLLANDAGFSFSIAGMQQAGALLNTRRSFRDCVHHAVRCSACDGGSVVRSTPQ
jgi:hypothetical protein